MVLGLLALAGVLGVQPIASAVPIPALDWVGRLADEAPHDSPFFLITSAACLLILASLLYLRSLNPYARRRSRLYVWLTALAPMIFLAGALAGWDVGSNAGPSPFTTIGVPAVVVLPPLLLLGLERAIRDGLARASRWALGRDWRRMAIHTARGCLRLEPDDPAMIERCGLLLAGEDEYQPAITLLEKLAPPRAGYPKRRTRIPKISRGCTPSTAATAPSSGARRPWSAWRCCIG